MKRDDLMWSYTYQECEPYLKHRVREVVVQELIIGLLKGGNDGGE